MRLVSFRHGSSAAIGVGILDGEEVLDLTEAAGLQPRSGRGVLDLIGRGDLAALQEQARRSRAIPLGDVTLAAPIPAPTQNIICLGRNYQEHAAEMARAREQEATPPTFFTKAVTTVIGPSDDIPYDADLSTQIDWEVELAFVIGRTGRHVSKSDAMSHVFGYMVLNDVSARDLQYGYGGQFFYGKSLDGSCPTGPVLVTADEVSDPGRLGIRLRLNGETKQESDTARMIHDVPSIIETLSRIMTLEPGQIVATGTPPGVGYAREPKEFLRPGDVMESEIDGIGTLSNSVRAV